MASEQEIREQYLYKVQILHPDGNQNKPTGVRKRAEEELKLINEAYIILKNSTNNPFIALPKLDIQSRKIRFRDMDPGQKKSTSFEIKSVGGSYSKFWIDDSPAPWLRVTDIKSLTSELLPLEVTIEAVGIEEPNRSYACSLAMRLENEHTKAKDEAVVRVELRMKDSLGNLEVEVKKPMKFKSVKPGILEGNIEIGNTGHGLLKGHLFLTRPWISISPDSIRIPPSTKTTYTVTIDVKNLPRHSVDKAFINIITNGGNERIPIEISLASIYRRKIFRFLPYLVLAGLPLAFVATYIPKACVGVFPVLWLAVIIYIVFLAWAVYRLRPIKKKEHKK